MIDVVIPIYNIKKRGFDRLDYMLYSLHKQDVRKAIIVDSSNDGGEHEIKHITKNYNFGQYLHLRSQEFNKPKLLNYGIGQATTDYIMCTDVDYIFSSDYIRVCKVHRSETKMLYKEVQMLPKMIIRKKNIDIWQFPKTTDNPHNKLANGACQYTTRKWFIENPYDERMSGWGVMDNMNCYMAKKSGLEIEWLDQGKILHQWHQVYKLRTSQSHKDFNRNVQILHNYRSENNLPKLL